MTQFECVDKALEAIARPGVYFGLGKVEVVQLTAGAYMYVQAKVGSIAIKSVTKNRHFFFYFFDDKFQNRYANVPAWPAAGCGENFYQAVIR